jgi:hypothetical protein
MRRYVLKTSTFKGKKHHLQSKKIEEWQTNILCGMEQLNYCVGSERAGQNGGFEPTPIWHRAVLFGFD